jgi:CBS domain-containing protein
VDADDTIVDAARIMRDADVGAVIVLQGRRVSGIATDRDIAVRAVADGRDPSGTTIAEIASKDIVALSPDEPIDRAVQVMREKAVRRLPVVEGDRPVGIVSIGDLAIQRDSESALADISASSPNN